MMDRLSDWNALDLLLDINVPDTRIMEVEGTGRGG
jgi:hypothetical protein